MTYPTDTLKNPYYFISSIDDKTIYNISEQQDNDGCGQHFVTYLTEDRFVKAGRSYLDLHGDRVQVTEDGIYAVKTNKIDIEECVKIFPYIKINYKETQESLDLKTLYLWLDYLIQNDDTYEDKFKLNTTHIGDGFEGGYISLFKQLLIEEMCIQFTYNTFDVIKKYLPDYILANEGDKIQIKNKTVYFVSMETSEDENPQNFSLLHISEEQFNDIYYECINNRVVNYANELLKHCNKKLKDDITIVGKRETIEATDDMPEQTYFNVIDLYPTDSDYDVELETTTYTLTLPAEIVLQAGEHSYTGARIWVTCDYLGDLTKIEEGTSVILTLNIDGGGGKYTMFINGTPPPDDEFVDNIYILVINEDTEVTIGIVPSREDSNNNSNILSR